MGRLPYWLRYYDYILQAEYEGRMAQLATLMKFLDEEGAAHANFRVAEPTDATLF